MKDTFHIRNPGPSVTGYSLGLFTVLESLPVLLMDAESEAAMLDPDNYGCVSDLLKALPSTMAVLFPCIIPHPSISIVCSVSYIWSVRCCSLLCFVDTAQQHPILWKGLLDIPAVQINTNSGADGRAKLKWRLRLSYCNNSGKDCQKEPNPAK